MSSRLFVVLSLINLFPNSSKMKTFQYAAFYLFFFCLVNPIQAQNTLGILQNSNAALDGYTLFAPMSDSNTYLIDNCGRLVQQWTSAYPPGLSVYLQEDGLLLRTERNGTTIFTAGGAGGVLKRLDWDSNVVWEMTINDDTQLQHHDVEVLPNGNILVIAWELMTLNQALDAGRDPASLGQVLWSEKILEIEPTGSSGGNVVWEWHLWDHLIQDFDATKQNFGVVADSPQRVDLNYFTNNTYQDWIHMNSIDYNEELDQILVCARNFHEVWIIDHSTTTAEAAGSTGGNSGKGGDLLYRWGNPQAYDRGTASDQVYFRHHDATWIPEGYPGEGEIMVFNNGVGRPTAPESTVDVFTPPLLPDGSYLLPANEAFGPDDLSWQYNSSDSVFFFSLIVSGAQRLSNGNTLICEGTDGRFLEVMSDGTIVWEYINPISISGPLSQGAVPKLNDVFRCTRYEFDYQGLAAQVLTPGLPIELNPDTSSCSLISAISTWSKPELSVYPNPSTGRFSLDFEGHFTGTANIHLYSSLGSLIYQTAWDGSAPKTLELENLAEGIYFLLLAMDETLITKRIVVVR